MRQDPTRPVQDRPLGCRAILPSTQVNALNGFSGRVVELAAAPKSGFVALRRFLLVTGSNTIRTCVQGFTALRDTGKPLSCDDGNFRV